MKKTIVAIVVGVLLAMPVQAAEFNKNLRFGMKDPDVLKLQEFLTDEELYTGPITGNFFSLTLRAVKAFQIREKLVASGYFNAITRTRANTLLDKKLEDQNADIIADSEAPQVKDNSIPADILALLQKRNSDADIQAKLLADKLAEQNRLLQDQVTKQQTQNDLLQKQLQNQDELNKKQEETNKKTEETLKKIAENTAPPPPAPIIIPPKPESKPEVLVNRPEKGWGAWDFTTKDDSFLIEALVVSTDNKEWRSKIGGDIIYIDKDNESNTKIVKGFNFINCPNLEYYFTSVANKSFPYICPGKEYYGATFNDAPIMGYGAIATDWMNRKTNFHYVIEKNQTYRIYVGPPIKLDYIKLVGQETGKIVEFTNL